MSSDPLNPLDATTAFATALVDEWARAGCTDAVVAPGSRSTPLALALVRHARFRVHVVLDERSAAFRALGIGLASGRPAILCCTSGTAAANFLPAVIEAAHARVPLLVCTADRPPELRDAGAGQTIDQAKLYGDFVRWYHDPGPPDSIAGAGATWRALARRVVAHTVGPPAGPVHLNLPFREPLVPTGAPLVDAPGRLDGAPWTQSRATSVTPDAALIEAVAATVRAHPNGVVAAGWGTGATPATVTRFARAAGWPVLADPVSGVRSGSHAISTYEGLLRSATFADAHRADLVLRIGASLTSKVANAWLDAARTLIVVDPDDAWLDPTHRADQRLRIPAEALLAAVAGVLEAEPERTDWLEHWQRAEQLARAAIDGVLDAADAPYEGVIARDVAASLPAGATLVVASSLPVRALEWCMAPRSDVRVLANRGANGIDGFVSTVAGVAAVAPTTVGLCGDLCFLHDVNGLLGADPAPTLVVVDNDGGGIFSFLPQEDLPEFERLFGTPHGLDLVAVARAHGVAAARVDDFHDLPAALAAGDAQVLVVPVDRAKSVARHRELWSAVAAAVSAG